MVWWMDVFVAVFGAAVGSFLNVCIWRLPEERSIGYAPLLLPGLRPSHSFS